MLFGAMYNVCSGAQGCKNERLGGDTMQNEDVCEGPYLTYVVYRSFKTPPPVVWKDGVRVCLH